MSVKRQTSNPETIQAEKEAIRTAILMGAAAAADAGKFTTLSMDEIFEIGIARAGLTPPASAPPFPGPAGSR